MGIASLHPSYGPYSAASRTYLAVGVRIVTSSSAAVGCSAIVASKSAFVAFIFTAIATAWMVSAAASPTMWQPSTRSVVASTTSFISTRDWLPDMVALIGRKSVL